MGAGDKKAKKEAKRTKKKEEATKDRLEKAVESKYLDVVIDDKKLRLQRWSIMQGLRVSKKLIVILQKATPLGISLESLMLADLGGLLEKHEEDIYEILAVSVEKNNFESYDDALEWIQTLYFPDAIELMGYIVKLDIVPLAQKAGKMKDLLSGVPGLPKVNAASPKV